MMNSTPKELTEMAQRYALDSVFSSRPERDDDWKQVFLNDANDSTFPRGFNLCEAYEGYSNDYICDVIEAEFYSNIQLIKATMRYMEGQS